MRLIDADRLKRQAEGRNWKAKDKFIELIEAAPTIEPVKTGACEQIKWERDIAIEQLNAIGKGLGETMDDVKPVKTGKWIEATNDDPCYYYCSECHWLSDIKTPYCPNCGARMGENDE